MNYEYLLKVYGGYEAVMALAYPQYHHRVEVKRLLINALSMYEDNSDEADTIIRQHLEQAFARIGVSDE